MSLHLNDSLKDRLAPWSVATEVLRYAREVKDVTSSQFHQHCESSPAALLQSVGRGERICTLRLFTPRQTCTILNKYSQIFWLGNSLTRQTLIGLLNLLSSNLQHIHKYTSNPRFPQFEEQAKEAELMCQCDGQFSVHSSCTSSYRLMALQEGIINVCSDIMGESFWKKSFQFEYYQPADMNRMHLSRCRDSETMNDIRPIVMYFEGGNIDPSAAPNKNSRHLDKYKHPRDFNIQAYFKRTLSSFITSYEKFYQFCPNGKSIPLHIIFSGVNAQSVHPQDRNGYKYKRADGSRLGADGGSSSDADLIDLNGRLFKYLQKWHPQVHLVNFLNLTVLPTDTADGYHYLTATNIQKATTLLRLMDMI